MSLTTTNIRPTRADIARQILTKNNGDLDKATTDFIALAMTDKELHDELLYIAARHALTLTASVDRGKAFETPKAPFVMNQSVKVAQERARRSNAVVQLLLLDMPVPIDGTVRPLRDWTGIELGGYADGEIAKSKTSLRRALFFKSVSTHAGEKKVGSALKEDALRKLQAEADGKVS